MIRQAISDDYEVITKYYLEFDNNNVDLFQSDPFSKFYVYELDGKIVAFINFSIIYDRCELNYIYVDTEYRKRKIASQLMDFFIEEVTKNNCINITLEVSENNQAGIRLYEKYKFVRAAIRENYYKDGNAILMIREFV